MKNIQIEDNIDRKNLESYISKLEILVYSRISDKEIEILKYLKDKILSKTVNFAVVGQFKRGKSSFINALLGQSILPVAVIPLTSVITIVKYSENLSSKVFFESGIAKEIETIELKSYIAESENPHNIKKVKFIEIGFPNNLLKQGIMFIDTPGIGSLHLNNTLSTYEYIPKLDAAIFITSSDPAISEIEIKLLNEVFNVTSKIFFVLNKIDYLEKNEIDEVVNYTKNQLKSNITNNEIKLFPVSSKIALNSKINNDIKSLEQSGFSDFENHLLKYFKNEKENILIDSVKRQLMNLIKEIKMGFELEVKSLLLPIEELNIKQKTLLENFNLFSSDDLKILEKTRSDIKLLISNFSEMINKNISDLSSKIKAAICKFENENQFLTRSKFKSELNKLFSQITSEELELSRNKLEYEIKEKSKIIFTEALNKYNSIINNIYKITSNLFDINLNEINYEKEYEIPPSFEYITYEFKLMFELNKSTFSFILPRKVYYKILTSKYLDRIDFTLNYNFTYIMDSIEKRLERMLIEYNIAFKNEIKITIEKINNILIKVRNMKENVEYKKESGIKFLYEKQNELESLKNSLINNIG